MKFIKVLYLQGDSYKIRLEKVDLGEIYIQKRQENFKKTSSSNTIGGPIHMSHPV